MRVTRRDLLTTAGTAGLAVAGGLLRVPPALAGAAVTLRLVAHSSYNEDSDKAIAKIGNEFAAKHNAAFAGEFIDQPEVAAKLTAEEQAQSGHDIVDLQDNLPAIHKNYLVPLDDVVAGITKEFGPFYQVAKDSGYVDGHWLSLPWLGNSELAVYRSDYFASIGEQPPANWNDLLRAAAKLKKAGHPVGIAISATEDSNAALYPLLWSFGGAITNREGRLTIDSPATNAALDYVRKLAAQMEPAIYSWDDSSNNKYILSGRGAYTINAPSIYLKAKRDKMAFAGAVKHGQPPAGPKGRFFYVDIHGWGIFKFSKNIELAKQLLRSMYTAESQKIFLTLGQGYDMPVLPHFDVNPPYTADPQLRPELNYMPQAHLASYPARPDARAEKAYQTFVLPNMFARAAQGASNKDAIAYAVKALRDIGYE
jgi:ABC-type glycerol-3-phosphate transport system substrate-binding protein